MNRHFNSILKITIFLLLAVVLGIFIYKWVYPQFESYFVLKITKNQHSSEEFKTPPPESLVKNSPQLCKITENKGKVIKVDLSQQKMTLCEDGKIIKEFFVSTGKKENSTPKGNFRVISKSTMIYSKMTDCWLPFWVGFKGNYGFHEVPICEEGEKRIGEKEIGKPASAGCIRLKIGEAEDFYHRVEIGTRIKIYGQTP
ncbi:MAG: hypothetical protein COU42_02845 [Candidatus Nealsonbacteria bacterium CG10_big_fil_rev_8_21_14_0_10_36_24]|uniref:L,D-TPase catalytic domain-containing protein n=2 Tax=Candidatus Nealsoniibacteriota TaxID=1817911 RepID=A0A2H0YPC6_9BACT|nr:MAG: hypothetical protein COU42_02845 [Candidatus Nealsonbacteria bacterium CG10_big_fil_rev_8_21_14_0_10_36_24]PIS40139.1 MAG: hypothetical protein COT32_01380 [Candidatus Nealsonbacteria bacterium CG08_land_8_20_14_0_20_36_22]